jgi:uncharacterized protein YndB with AHSA1/START domain
MTPKTINPTEQTADREIVISRVFDAPREVVWQAMTDPQHVIHWWGPRGFTTTIEEMDVRVGGVWKHIMHGPDGTNYPNESVFKEIVKPERIYTVTFTEQGGKTLLTLRARPFNVTAAAAPHLPGMKEGWTQSLERLAAFVAQV